MLNKVKGQSSLIGKYQTIFDRREFMKKELFSLVIVQFFDFAIWEKNLCDTNSHSAVTKRNYFFKKHPVIHQFHDILWIETKMCNSIFFPKR